MDVTGPLRACFPYFGGKSAVAEMVWERFGRHPAPPPPSTIETVRDPRGWGLCQLTDTHPSCWNGCVQIRRYRVTVEEIAEPREVLCARLQTLWDECDNHHHRLPLKCAAAALGYALNGDAGSKRHAP